MRAILSNLTVVFLQKDGARMLYRLKTALPSKGPKMSHSFMEEMPSTLHRSLPSDAQISPQMSSSTTFLIIE